jgi:pyridoxal 5'-phosphate synthase pdxT subunit
MSGTTIGVLALQGAVREHLEMLKRCGARGMAVKYPSELLSCDGLIIPGGESTTIGKLIVRDGFLDALRERASSDLPVFGTCAGLIVLARRVTEGDQPLLGLMDILVRRNAYGRQVDSFEADLRVGGIGEEERPFRAVFIRAPWIEEAGEGVEVMCSHRDRTVMARQGRFLASAFHPELTGDERIHSYFINMVEEYKA